MTSPTENSSGKWWTIVAVICALVTVGVCLIDVQLKRQILEGIKEAQSILDRTLAMGGVSVQQKVPAISGRIVAPTNPDPSFESGNGSTPLVDAPSGMEETEPPNEAGKGRSQFVGQSQGTTRPSRSRSKSVRS